MYFKNLITLWNAFYIFDSVAIYLKLRYMQVTREKRARSSSEHVYIMFSSVTGRTAPAERCAPATWRRLCYD